jgi:hypothetical protein
MRHLYCNDDRAVTECGFADISEGIFLNRFASLAVAMVVLMFAFAVASLPASAQKTSQAKAKQSTTTAKTTAKKTAADSIARKASQSADSATAPAPAKAADSYNLSAVSALREAPSSSPIGELQKGANVTVLARDRGWTRVQVTGWVPDSLLTPADTLYRADLSAADLRADPDAVRGKTVMWTVQFLALETADPLRQGMADGEPYMLARGPKTENALLYLVLPPSLIGTARALQPLEKISVTARVRDGRSEPIGIPILDIQTIRRIR